MPIELLALSLGGSVLAVLAGIGIEKLRSRRRRKGRELLFRPSESPPKVYENRPQSEKERYGVRKTKARITNRRPLRVPPKQFPDT